MNCPGELPCEREKQAPPVAAGGACLYGTSRNFFNADISNFLILFARFYSVLMITSALQISALVMAEAGSSLPSLPSSAPLETRMRK